MQIVWLCLLVAVTGAVEFHLLEGKMADPCNKGLLPHDPFRKDCEKHTQLPDPAVTILIPSVTSGGSTTTPTGSQLYQRRLVATGIGFPRAATTAFALATNADSCRNIDTTIQAVKGTTNALGTEVSFQIVSGWDSLQLELENRPRLLCWSPRDETLAPAGPALWRYTGFKFGVVWNCESKVDADQTAKCASDTVRKLSANWREYTPLQREARIQRSVCCKGTIADTIGAGQCINPNVQACCGGAAYDVASERCCNSTAEWISQVDGFCPCSRVVDCPVGESCCLPTKYSELQPKNTTGIFPLYRGHCYAPTRFSCCDTGSVYDPGSHQCCVINGIQSINIPCPCGKDTDCQGGQVNSIKLTNHTCCQQTGPVPKEASAIGVSTHETEPGQTDSNFCSKYANWPTGQGAHRTQRCLGSCIDPSYQICCNGVACMKNYEKCCNATCCNRWSATCFNSLRPAQPGSPFNSNDFGSAASPTIFEVCSSIEAITTVKGFWIFVLPSTLLLTSHLGLALAMVFATKATPRSFSKLEFSMMGLAVLISYLAMLFFFAPIWKYGVWLVLSQLVVFLTASARIRWLNVLSIIIQLITLVYLYDPIHGNALLTLTDNRILSTPGVSAADNVMESGILHALSMSFHTTELVATQRYCATYYDYFRLDPALRDTDRFDNPQITTFAYCSRNWILTLLICAATVMVGVLIQFVLGILGLFFRFHLKDPEVEYEE